MAFVPSPSTDKIDPIVATSTYNASAPVGIIQLTGPAMAPNFVVQQLPKTTGTPING